MKNMTGLVLGLIMVVAFAGCQKKEAKAPVEEPIVTEETSATAMANMEMNAMGVPTDMNVANGAVPSALEAASSAVEQTVAAVIENPTPQQIQEALKSAGYYEGKVDGSIGPKTKNAIEKFQTENGLKADGKVGPRTWAKLGTHLAAGVVDSVSSAATPVTEPILESDPLGNGQEPVNK